MSKTQRRYQTKGNAGQVVWLLDVDSTGNNPVIAPTGYLKLSTTTTTTITNAATLYPSLYARFTSTSSTSPIYRSGNNLIIQRISGFPRRTRGIALSFTSHNWGRIDYNQAIFYNDTTIDSGNLWRMNFQIVAACNTTNPQAVISGITLVPQAVPINCCVVQWGVYPVTHIHTALIDQSAGCRMFSNTGNYVEYVTFSGDVPIAQPTAYLSASVMETPMMTPFIRLYDDLPV